MIDNQDKQTQPLDLEPAPKRRGRPAKQNALSNAERQRLYRERQKTQRNEKPESQKVPYEEVVGIAQELGERCKKAEERVKELEKELAQRNGNSNSEEVERLTKNFRLVHGEMERAKVKAVEKGLKIAQLEKQIELLKAELKKKTRMKQRNESPSRLNEGMQKLVQDMHEVADAIEGSTWRIQRKARVNGNWVTLKGSYWNEAQAEDALAALPNKKGGWWRIIEVKSEVED